jgi:glutathione S-transferase
LPFKHVPVMQAYRLPNGSPNALDSTLNTRSQAFLAVNPNGHIPTIDDDGLVLHESLAINLYLAKKHGGPLAPAHVAEDGLMSMWSLWAVTELETHALNVLYHTIGKPPAERDPNILTAAVEHMKVPFAVLDKALAATAHAVGGRFTVADLNLAEVVRYASPVPELFDAAPHVKAWLAACRARPAFQAMWAKRNEEPA